MYKDESRGLLNTLIIEVLDICKSIVHVNELSRCSDLPNGARLIGLLDALNKKVSIPVMTLNTIESQLGI